MSFQQNAFQTSPLAFQVSAPAHVCPTPDPRPAVTPAHARAAVTAALPREC